MINPLLPAYAPVRLDDSMLIGFSAWICDKRFDVSQSGGAFWLGNQFDKLGSDQFLALPSKVPAVGVVDKGECGVRTITANKFGLSLHHISVTLFAGA